MTKARKRRGIEDLAKRGQKSIGRAFEFVGNGLFGPKVRNLRQAVSIFDKQFFKKDNLPKFGKEYWFLLFSGYDGSQVASMFGRVNDVFSVNGRKVDGRRADKNNISVTWYLGKKKRDFGTRVAEVSIDEKRVEANSSKDSVSVEKSGQDYVFSYKDGKKERFRARADLPQGTSYIHEEKLGSTLGFYNLFPKFKGRLDGKKIEGRCLLQKIRYNLPFVPWNWVWLAFEDGSFLNYFIPYVESPLPPQQIMIRNNGFFYSGKTKKHYMLYDMGLERRKGKDLYFFVDLNTGGRLRGSVKNLASKRFKFKTKGEFTYIENMGRVTDFYFESGKEVLDMDSLGKGVAFIEETSGFMI
jgi:hypothetical protein